MKLENISNNLKPITEANKLNNWITSLLGLAKAEGIDYVFLTREEMEAREDSYPPDEGSDEEDSLTYQPFPEPPPEKPPKSTFNMLPSSSSPNNTSATNISDNQEGTRDAQAQAYEQFGRDTVAYNLGLARYEVECSIWEKREEEHNEKERRRIEKKRGKQKRKRHRKDKLPTIAEWEEMNRRLCGALIPCVPNGLVDFTTNCNLVNDILEKLRRRYIWDGEVEELNQKERYRMYAFQHTKDPQAQFDALEKLERVAMESGVKLSEGEKLSMLLARLDDKWKKLILQSSLSNPLIISSYEHIKQHLINLWKLEVSLHLHGEKRDNRDKSAEQALYAGERGGRGGREGRGVWKGKRRKRGRRREKWKNKWSRGRRAKGGLQIR